MNVFVILKAGYIFLYYLDILQQCRTIGLFVMTKVFPICLYNMVDNSHVSLLST